MNQQHAAICLIACALAWPAVAGAQTTTATRTQGTVVDTPRTGGSEAALDTPTRGMSKARVITAHGEPRTRRGPVGDPPISHWQYPGFSVYFEYDKVLHSVVPGDPPKLRHRGELAAGN